MRTASGSATAARRTPGSSPSTRAWFAPIAPRPMTPARSSSLTRPVYSAPAHRGFGSDHAPLAQEGNGVGDGLRRLALVDLEHAQGGRRQPIADVVPLDVAVARRAVVRQPGHVVQVRADAALAVGIEPEALVDEPEPPLHLGMPDVVPVAGELGVVVADQLVGLVRLRDLVVVQAVLDGDRDAGVLRVPRELLERVRRRLQPGAALRAPPLVALDAQRFDALAVARAAVVQAPQLPLRREHLAADAAED